MTEEQLEALENLGFIKHRMKNGDFVSVQELIDAYRLLKQQGGNHGSESGSGESEKES